MRMHVTVVNVVTKPNGAITATAHARCSCGWQSDDFAHEEEAIDRATLHQRNAALAEIIP